MATTPLIVPQTNVIEPALQPWQRIAWTTQQEQIIYRDWGIFFSYQQHPDIASHYYDKSLAIKDNDPNALYFRSVCKRDMAKCEDALRDALLAAELEPYNPRTSIAIADAYYGLNEFEKEKIDLHDSTRKYVGSVINEFLNRIVIVDENLKDTLGDCLNSFLRKHEALIANVAKEILQSKYKDNRPRWKKLKAEGKCDVLSIIEPEEELLSQLEIARRNRTFKVFNQIYMGRAWSDVLFMSNLQKDQNWCTPQFKESSPLLRDLVITKYGIVKKFIKMLHSRSPLYNEWIRKFPNEKLRNQHRENYLNYVQYATRREMIIALRKIKQYRKTGPLVAFAHYVEHIMGQIAVRKTQRVMPWKFEFMNEVYNTFALHLTDRFKARKLPNKIVPRHQLFNMLHINMEPKERAANFEFGNKATCLSSIENDTKLSTYKKFIVRLEKRMRFAKYSIEKCYLWHGMAAAHFLQGRYDECCELSRKGIEESIYCNGRIWAFLCSMLIVRSHAALHKIERCKDALMEAREWAMQLRDDKLIDFVDLVHSINDEYIDLKKKSRSRDTFRRRRLSSATIESADDDRAEVSAEVSERTLL